MNELHEVDVRGREIGDGAIARTKPNRPRAVRVPGRRIQRALETRDQEPSAFCVRVRSEHGQPVSSRPGEDVRLPALFADHLCGVVERAYSVVVL